MSEANTILMTTAESYNALYEDGLAYGLMHMQPPRYVSYVWYLGFLAGVECREQSARMEVPR